MSGGFTANSFYLWHTLKSLSCALLRTMWPTMCRNTHPPTWPDGYDACHTMMHQNAKPTLNSCTRILIFSHLANNTWQHQKLSILHKHCFPGFSLLLSRWEEFQTFKALRLPTLFWKYPSDDDSEEHFGKRWILAKARPDWRSWNSVWISGWRAGELKSCNFQFSACLNSHILTIVFDPTFLKLGVFCLLLSVL